jgi:hypothetical protein
VQTYASDAGDLHAWIFDGHLRTEVLFPSLLASLRLEAEGAAITGGSSHVASLNGGSVRVDQQGLAARLTGTRENVEAELEVGYMSGDSNPFDTQANAFTANRDYKVGLVLWDEVMLFQSQNAARRLGDPRLVSQPPSGVDVLPTEGAVTNALYFNPKIRYRPRAFGGTFKLVLGALFTHAPQPVSDPYESFLASAPRNVFGAPAGQSYGTELDAAISWRRALSDDQHTGLELGVQYGVLFPGDVFTRGDGSKMDPVQALRFRTNLSF